MDVFPSPQPCAVGEVDKKQTDYQNGPSYAAAVTLGNDSAKEVSRLELCPVYIEKGIPTVEFTVEDVNSFTREEGLHQAVVIKFSYGKPAFQELRQILPKHFEVKGKYSIGQLEYCHILVRFNLFDDFAKVVSRSSGYVQSKGDEFFFRTFPWTMGFNPREETSKAVVWISFPQLPANLFARKSLMSIASAVGKPITVDKATKDRTRPSTAHVKVLINILDKHPNKIKIKIFDTKTGKLVENDQQIVIDNLPKYCTLCNHRDHDVKSCRWNTEDFNGKVDHSNETVGNYSLIESGRDARELLNEIKASRRSEMSSNSSKVVTAQQHVFVSNSTAIDSLSRKNALIAQQCIDNSTDTLLQNFKNVPIPNLIVSESLRRSNDLSADKRKNTYLHTYLLTATDIAQHGNSSVRSKMKVPREQIIVEPPTTKNTVSLKSTNIAVFENSIANSTFEIGSVSGIKDMNAQQKSHAKQLRDMQSSGTNANADAAESLVGTSQAVTRDDQQLSTIEVTKHSTLLGASGCDDRENLNEISASRRIENYQQTEKGDTANHAAEFLSGTFQSANRADNLHSSVESLKVANQNASLGEGVLAQQKAVLNNENRDLITNQSGHKQNAETSMCDITGADHNLMCIAHQSKPVVPSNCSSPNVQSRSNVDTKDYNSNFENSFLSVETAS